jgi:hypothetical protein
MEGRAEAITEDRVAGTMGAETQAADNTSIDV